VCPLALAGFGPEPRSLVDEGEIPLPLPDDRRRFWLTFLPDSSNIGKLRFSPGITANIFQMDQ